MGRRFVGSATNWRGLHEAGVCVVRLGHAGLLPPAAWRARAQVHLGVQSRMLALAHLGAAQQRAQGLPGKWAGAGAYTFTQVQRSFLHVLVVRHGVVDQWGGVFSAHVAVAGAGCKDVHNTLCKGVDFPAHAQLRAAAQRATAHSNASYASLFQFAFQQQRVPAPSDILHAVRTHSSSNGSTIVVPLNSFWSEGYYHWSFEALPRLWAALPLLELLPSAKVLLRPGQLGLAFVKDALRIMGIPHSRVLQHAGHLAADWVLVPPGASCGHQMPVGELVSLAAFVIRVALQGAAPPLAATATAPPPLPHGALSDAAAFAHIAKSASHTPLRALLDAARFPGALPVRAPAPRGNVSHGHSVETRQVGDAPSPSVPMGLAGAGAAFVDAACDGMFAKVEHRNSPGLHVGAADVRSVKGAVDWEGTAALAALDSACAARAERGHRLVLLLKRSSRRWIANHGAVKAWLASRLAGEVTVVEVTTGALQRQAVLFRCADLVVAPHGAGLSALLFAREGTRVVEVLPGSGTSPSTYMQAATLRSLVYTAVLADNKADQMQISWETLSAALGRVGEA